MKRVTSKQYRLYSQFLFLCLSASLQNAVPAQPAVYLDALALKLKFSSYRCFGLQPVISIMYLCDCYHSYYYY